MLDSERTGEIHLVEELTGRELFARWLREAPMTEELEWLLNEKPELSSRDLDMDQLRALPAGSLGRAYIEHLDDNGLSADSQAAPTTEVDDPEVAFMVRRFRQTHDVWHALLGLGTSGHEEVVIHAFSWGQLRLPVSALVVSFGSLKHIVIERRWGLLRRGLGEAYRVGRDAAPLLGIAWEQRWDEPIEDVRDELGLRALA